MGGMLAGAGESRNNMQFPLSKMFVILRGEAGAPPPTRGYGGCVMYSREESEREEGTVDLTSGRIVQVTVKLLGPFQGQGWKRAFWGRGERRAEARRCAGPGEHVQRPTAVHVQVSMFKGPQVCTGSHKQWEEQELGLDR